MLVRPLSKQNVTILQPMTMAVPNEESASKDERFAALVERQSLFVFRVAYARLRNRADAEDVVQETFLRLYRTSAWERMEDERGFLARTAWRLARNRRKIVAFEDQDRTHEENAEQSQIRIDEGKRVQRLIASLPSDLREPLVLSALEELSSREVAGILAIPEGTVRTRVMRARQMLKEKLSGTR